MAKKDNLKYLWTCNVDKTGAYVWVLQRAFKTVLGARRWARINGYTSFRIEDSKESTVYVYCTSGPLYKEAWRSK